MIMPHQLRMRPTSGLSERPYRLLSRHRIVQRVPTGCAPRGCLPLGRSFLQGQHCWSQHRLSNHGTITIVPTGHSTCRDHTVM